MYDVYVKLRDARGVTDYKVAKETNIPPSTFSDWRAGRSEPKVGKLMKLAKYFDVPIETFLEKP